MMKQLKFIPTWKIKEILEDPYCRGVDGKDYEPYKSELQAILWDRLEKESDRTFNKILGVFNHEL